MALVPAGAFELGDGSRRTARNNGAGLDAYFIYSATNRQ